MTDSLLTPAVMATVGTRTGPREGVVTAEHIRRFAAAIDDPDPLYLDPAAARAAGYPDVIAPPLFAAAVTRPVPFRAGLLDDGQYEDLAPPGLGHLQTMLAGQSWELLRPAVAGERLVETSTTTSITERRGKTGPIVFVEKEAMLTTVTGEPVERYTNTLILRAPPPPLPPRDPGSAAVRPVCPATELDGDRFVKHPDMIALFMFCAAIWAVHRIHWDAPYAQAEGLPQPVLPGWMVASYLGELANRRAPAGQRVRSLAVRYRSSAFPGDRLAGTSEAAGPGRHTLRLVNADGVEVATADAATA